MAGWKWLFFDQPEFVRSPQKSDQWNRGAYLVKGPAHCAACHTERNAFGAPADDQMNGTSYGPNGHPVPGINGDNHIKDWTEEDVVFGLQTGFTPDGDVLGGAMREVIEEGTSYLSDADLKAIAVYLKSLAKEN